jgi:hypothetical protein
MRVNINGAIIRRNTRRISLGVFSEKYNNYISDDLFYFGLQR